MTNKLSEPMQSVLMKLGNGRGWPVAAVEISFS